MDEQGRSADMPLFVAQHTHQPEACAASGWTARLRAHVTAGGAACYRVAIQAEAVVAETHTLLLIVEAAEQAQVEHFMAAFAPWGPVAVYAAAPAEEVAARGGCGAARPP
jgi:hypothetical protein